MAETPASHFRHVALLTWIAEIERYCAAINAYRAED